MITQSLTLKNGALKFSANAKGSGPLVLLLHGFPDTLRTFDLQLDALSQAGYRAVAVSMRGYEASSQPADDEYSQTAIANDVVSFIAELGVGKAHLIGHDWGAAIAYVVGSIAPHKLLSLTAISLPHSGRFINDIMLHPRQLRLSWYILLFQVPRVAEFLISRNRYLFIRNLWRDWSPNWIVPPAIVDHVIDVFENQGVLSASLNYYRGALSVSSFSRRSRAAAKFKINVPTLAIAGELDACIDSSAFEKMMYPEDFPKGLEFNRIKGAGHFPHLEKSDMVNKLLLSCIKQNDE